MIRLRPFLLTDGSFKSDDDVEIEDDNNIFHDPRG